MVHPVDNDHAPDAKQEMVVVDWMYHCRLFYAAKRVWLRCELRGYNFRSLETRAMRHWLLGQRLVDSLPIKWRVVSFLGVRACELWQPRGCGRLCHWFRKLDLQL